LGIKTNILVKRSVVISLIGFSIIVTAGIIMIFRSSVQKDADHVHLVEVAGDVETEILQARIYLDEIIFENNKALVPELGQSLDSVRYNLEELNRLICRKDVQGQQMDIKSFRVHYDRIMKDLVLIEDQIEKDGAGEMVTDTALFNAFSRFNLNYRNLQSCLPQYLLLDTVRLKNEIIGVIIVNFLIVLGAGFYMLRLINQLIHADRMMVRRTIEVEQRERERIAADLHDSLGSLLSGLLIHIQVLEKESEVDPELKGKLNHLNFLGNLALQSIEEVINNLNSSLVSRYGLVRSLEKITEKYNKLGKIQFSIDAGQLRAELPESTELLLHRICSELISNALRHSSAENAEFIFCSHKKTVHLTYRDDGVGFDQESVSYEKDKSGLHNMMRRIESMDGKFEIHSEPGKGVEMNMMIRIQ
jgi:signal transduction histidine kinase